MFGGEFNYWRGCGKNDHGIIENVVGGIHAPLTFTGANTLFGGICGENYNGTIESAESKILSSISVGQSNVSGCYCGGLVGKNGGVLQNSQVMIGEAGKLNSLGSGARTGGLVGTNYANVGEGINGKIVNCFIENNGIITGTAAYPITPLNMSKLYKIENCLVLWNKEDRPTQLVGGGLVNNNWDILKIDEKK